MLLHKLKVQQTFLHPKTSTLLYRLICKSPADSSVPKDFVKKKNRKCTKPKPIFFYSEFSFRHRTDQLVIEIQAFD